MADEEKHEGAALDEWAVNERLNQKRQQMVKRVEDGLVEEPELKDIGTIGVTLETGGTIVPDRIHLVGTVPSVDLKELAADVAKRAAGRDTRIVDELEVEK